MINHKGYNLKTKRLYLIVNSFFLCVCILGVVKNDVLGTNYEVNMQSENLPSGSYFYKITNCYNTELRKMLLVK